MEKKRSKREYSSFVEKIDELAHFFAEELGLASSQSKRDDLWRAIKEIALIKRQDPKELLIAMLSSPLTEEDRARLTDAMTINETYFFREMKSLEVFRDTIIKERACIQDNSSPLKIWSAGCSTGEEPYSLAILLRQAHFSRYLDYHIYGTDINSLALKKAKEGVYREWSFRAMDLALTEQYFQRLPDGLYAINPMMKERVSFSYLNLAQDSYPSILTGIYDLDVIFCRNVLIYFTPTIIEEVVGRLYRSLKEGGWLIVSPCEVSLLASSPFLPVYFSDVTLFAKKKTLPNHLCSFPVKDNTKTSLDGGKKTTLDTFAHEKPLRKEREREIEKQREKIAEKAQLAYEEGDHVRALATLEEHFKEHGYRGEEEDENSPLLLMARILADLGQLKEALLFCQRSLQFDGASPSLYFLKALIYQELREKDHAIKNYKRSLYLQPSFAPAYYMLGSIALQDGSIKEAKRYFHNATALLSEMPKDTILPELDGMSVKTLLETIPKLLEEVKKI